MNNPHAPPLVPPRPPSASASGSYQSSAYNQGYYPPPPPPSSGPHIEEPLVAPKPWKVEPDLGVNMAKQLDDQLGPNSSAGHPNPYGSPPPGPGSGPGGFSGGFQSPSPYHQPAPPAQPPYGGPPGGFAGGFAGGFGLSSPPPPSHYPTPGPYPPPGHTGGYETSLNASMANMTFSNTPQAFPPDNRQSSYGPPQPAPQVPQGASKDGELTATLPNIQHLTGAIPVINNPTHDSVLKVSFIRDTLFLLERAFPDAPSGQPLNISDQALVQLANTAIPALLQLCNQFQSPTAVWQAEALYLRGGLESSGHFPQHVPHNPRQAFRDFEAAAKGGYASAWFRLGRDYEQFGDSARAKDCFERGIRANDPGCAYRLGIAALLSQLTYTNQPSNPLEALPKLLQSAKTATLQAPQGPYVLALLMMGEFPSLPTNGQVGEGMFWTAQIIPPGSTIQLEAKKWLERSAYLHFAPAQYKLGHAYEFASPPFPYSPLMSVQFYSLASQAGEVEADMALSKWFLCGADGAEGDGGFEKDEALALTFADKAARKGLPSAEFAMGYYAEVGIGGNGVKDLAAARRWYEKASAHGNTDAPGRLKALDEASSLSRQEHEQLTQSTLGRKRTQAKQKSDANYGGPMPMSPPAHNVMANVRKQSLMPPIGEGGSGGGYGGPQAPSFPSGPSPSSYGPRPGSGSGSPGYPNPSFQQQQQQQQGGPGPGPRPGSGAGFARPQKSPQQQQLAHMNRISLTDGPAQGRPPSSGSGPKPSQTPPGGGKYGPQGGKPVTGGIGGGGKPASGGGGGGAAPPKKPGPATFAEMGFQGVKAEDKECVIM
ncbi:hypothetical protein DL96DRAFT_1599360 [Flagelloscypha sp. PMI_526]|nr:hypothetical protein DL96DRAFT_1599360 [Flagelloscypha sp. PMI_526]